MCARHYEADQARRRASGEWAGYMSADEVNAHIQTLQDAGMSLQRIGRLADISEAGVRRLAGRKRVWRTHGERILAIDPRGFYPGEDTGYVSAVGTARRLQALIAIGYTQRDLAGRLGITADNLGLIIRERASVYISTAQAVDELFQSLQMEPAPPSAAATFSRERAKKQGWPPPLAWDEETIDDPEAEPMGVEPVRANRAKWLDSYWELKEWGMSDERIADRLGLKYDSMITTLRRTAS